jgi:hypothetical protein
MSKRLDPYEVEMLPSVKRLFGEIEYRLVEQAPLSRKRIDALFLPKKSLPWISVELKVRDWRKALWQAALNAQLADLSFIAIWHRALPSALLNRDLFALYGVGIISVDHECASIVVDAARSNVSDLKSEQQRLTLNTISRQDECGEVYVPALSLLPA